MGSLYDWRILIIYFAIAAGTGMWIIEKYKKLKMRSKSTYISANDRK